MLLFSVRESASAATGDKLQFDVFIGYDSAVSSQCWAPITFEIKNDGPSINGTLELYEGAGEGRGTVRRLSIELPTGTLKRVSLPVFVNGTYPVWSARLFDAKRRVVAEKISMRPQLQVSGEYPCLGSLSRTHAGHPVFEPVKQNYNSSKPASVRLLPQLFPEDSLALDGLSAIYLNSERVIDLNPKQAEALLEWLRGGGKLIVALEQPQDLEGSSWFNALVPFRATGFVEVPRHDFLQQWVTGGWPAGHARPRSSYAPARLQKNKVPDKTSTDAPFSSLEPDATFEAAGLRVLKGESRGGVVTMSAGDVPLVLESSYGMGKVVTLLFSPEREPVRSWKHLPVFWARIAEVPRESYIDPADYYPGSQQSVEGVIGAMLETSQVRKLPIPAMFLMLLCYLGVIGPIDYLLVRRLNRPMLTWATFPCYVLAFSGIIYLVGFKLRAGALEWNELNIVDAIASQPEAPLKGRTYSLIYSPSNRRYTLQGPGGKAALRTDSGTWYQPDIARLDVRLHGDSFTASAEVPVWSSRMFVSEWSQPGAAPLEVSVLPTRNGYELNCRNRSAQALEVSCIASDRLINCGSLKGHEQRLLILNTNEAPRLSKVREQQSTRMQNAVQARNYAFRSSGQTQRLDTWQDYVPLISCLNTNHLTDMEVPRRLDLSTAANTTGTLILFAAGDTSSGMPSMISEKPERTRKMTIWRIVLQTQNSSGAAAKTKPLAEQ